MVIGLIYSAMHPCFTYLYFLYGGAFDQMKS